MNSQKSLSPDDLGCGRDMPRGEHVHSLNPAMNQAISSYRARWHRDLPGWHRPAYWVDVVLCQFDAFGGQAIEIGRRNVALVK